MSDAAALDARLAAEWRNATGAAALPDAAAIAGVAGPERATRTAIVAEIDEIRLRLADMRTSLDEASAAEPATRRWTIRDVLAHLASWAWQTSEELERLRSGRAFDEVIHFGTTGPHAWNERAVNARRRLSLDELFDEADAQHERLIDLVVSIPESELRQTVDLPRTIGEPPAPWRMPTASAILMSCWHARLHLNRLDALLQSNGR